MPGALPLPLSFCRLLVSPSSLCLADRALLLRARPLSIFCFPDSKLHNEITPLLTGLDPPGLSSAPTPSLFLPRLPCTVLSKLLMPEIKWTK